jgi:hypothetical protein
MSLSADELNVITHLIAPLPVGMRDAFISAIEAALTGRVRGVGIVYRTAVQLRPSYFTPPPVTPKPQHLNSRKLRSVARSEPMARQRRDAL